MIDVLLTTSGVSKCSSLQYPAKISRCHVIYRTEGARVSGSAIAQLYPDMSDTYPIPVDELIDIDSIPRVLDTGTKSTFAVL